MAVLDSIPRRRMSRTRRTDIVASGILAVLTFVGLFPYLFLLLTSFKSNEQFYDSYWVPTWPLQWGNYSVAWQQVSPYLYTSFIVAAFAIVGTIGLSSVAGYVFARFRFPGREVMFGFLAALLMIPSLTSLVPLFILMRDLNLLDTRLVIIVPHVVGGTVLGTVLIRQSMEQIPEELFEAARVDGAGAIRIFFSHMLPLSRPVIGTVSLITMLGVWNDYFWPLLTVSTDEFRTVPAGLAFFAGQNVQQWGPLFAGYLLASLPLLIVFALLSKLFLTGLHGGMVADK